MLNKITTRLRRKYMPSFEPQTFSGYKFRLQPNGLLRTVVSYFYHYKFIYFNGRRINFDLLMGIPFKKIELEPIKYEWQLYDKKDMKIINRGSGIINLTKNKFGQVIGSCNGSPMEKMIVLDLFGGVYLGIPKAVNLGYVVDDMKCIIKLKFDNGKEEYESEPMVVFNIFDKDEFHKTALEVIIGAFIGGAVGYLIGRLSK